MWNVKNVFCWGTNGENQLLLCSSKNYLYAIQLKGTQGAKAWPVLRETRIIKRKYIIFYIIIIINFLFKQYSNKTFAPRVTKTQLGGLQLLLTGR